ncbi:uncharacterized protein PAC_10502 [Phialocephala subalpina]|uniref:Period circadian protein n=1 Tax=Phialocephala subalpina TaxID=576137 RepID=A0A1L7X6F4_9HELO|nr:uncharacterized protein PAC_10502 [Phialocephala subalpina]
MSTIDKVKNALHLNKDHSTTSTTHNTTTHTGNGIPEGTAGPHNSRVANAADPRIDSDLDSSRHTGNTHGTGVAGAPSAYQGAGAGVTGTSHSATTTAGPHSSNLANKADPRIDSDLDGSRNFDPRIDSDLDGSRNLGAGSTTTGNSAYTSPNAGTGYGGTSGATTHSTSTAAGPHNSNLLNKVGKVDSDRDGSRNLGTATGNTTGTHTGHTTGTHVGHNTHGTSGSVVADNHGARVGPGATTGGVTGAGVGSHVTPGSGNAANTAGPHNSDLLNKVDPRVDSDLSGGKTYGGNKTHA